MATIENPSPPRQRGTSPARASAQPAQPHDPHSRRRGVVVMKFGGTSVADPVRLRTVAARLVAGQDQGDQIVGVLSAMGSTTDELLALARAVSSYPDPRELDMLLSVGERISCALCAMAIHDLGREAISLTGAQAGIVTDGVHGKAKIVDVRARRIHQSLAEGRIVLVAGFQGVSPAQDVTTLGRGGSDTTAIALAAALGAEACEIYTDVEGVFTADPRAVAGARKLHALTYAEMLEMSASGAKVLQARAVEYARSHKIKVHVRSGFNATDGTWIVDEDDRMQKAMISGVTHTVDERVYRVETEDAASLFGALAARNVNVDTILQSAPGEIVFSAPAEDQREIALALGDVNLDWTVRTDLGKVSLVGAGMRTHPGIAAQAFATLAAERIEPALVSTSPIKIAWHIAAHDVERAARALHEAFALDSPEATRAHP